MNRKPDLFLFIRKNALLLCLVAAAVIVLLLLADGAQRTENISDSGSVSVEKYRAEEEKRLKTLLEKTEGVGKAEVMITVSKSEELITSKDITATSEKTVLLDRDGSDCLSVVSTASPVIAGVAVVCDGGGDTTVKNEIVSLVGRLYGLSAAEIHVSQRSKEK